MHMKLKKAGRIAVQKSPVNVRQKLERFGADKLQIFDIWLERFGPI